MTPGWLDDLNTRGVLEVAQALGLDTCARPGPGSVACPACGSDRRGAGDHRGAAGVTRDGRGWRCHRCGIGGSAVTLAAHVVLGRVPERGDSEAWGRLRAACAEAGLCAPASGARVATPRRPRRAPRPPAPPQRPPAGEVAQLWSECRPVLEDSEVSSWLRGRGLDPGDVELRDLCRALPAGLAVPSWVTFGGATWGEAGYRAILPMFDSDGRLASLRARTVRPTSGPKAVAPTGVEVRGLVLAGPLARLLLTGASLTDGSSAAELVANVGLVVTEGEPDFLVWATHWSDAREDAFAAVGVVAGSWTTEIAARIPDGCQVTVATHRDPDGDRYAAQVVASFVGRTVRLRRWAPPAVSTKEAA